jgi:sulfite exporter TauE/SafE
VTGLDFGVMLTLGLLGSLHCVQMCGPIVLSYSVSIESLTTDSKPASLSLLRNHLAYNSGRILTYTALGAIAGMAGQTMGFIGRLAGFSHAVALITGGLMIFIGIAMLGILPTRWFGSRLLRIPSFLLQRTGRLLSAPAWPNRLVLGLILGFLPCGLIYAAVLRAMATGSPIAGAATMFGFGLGTASALIALGMFSSALRIRLNRWGSQVAAVGITMMGLLLVWRGTLPGMLMMEQHMHGHH